LLLTDRLSADIVWAAQHVDAQRLIARTDVLIAGNHLLQDESFMIFNGLRTLRTYGRFAAAAGTFFGDTNFLSGITFNGLLPTDVTTPGAARPYYQIINDPTSLSFIATELVFDDIGGGVYDYIPTKSAYFHWTTDGLMTVGTPTTPATAPPAGSINIAGQYMINGVAVEIGAPDSGGLGYRALVVPN
jgi:hypothetical protein